jgi:hypothetical protein
VIFSVSCVTAPKPDFCEIEGRSAHCYPTSTSKAEYDKDLDDMVGYLCTSNKDFASIKKYFKKVLEKLK